MDLPLYYEVTESNVPNRDLAVQGITFAGTIGLIRGRGVVAPGLAGQFWRVMFMFTPAHTEDGETIDLPLKDIPHALGVQAWGIESMFPYAIYGSEFTATFSLSKILPDGTEVSAGAPDPIDYDATDLGITASTMQRVNPNDFQVADAEFLRVTLTDPANANPIGIDQAPLPVTAWVRTTFWD